MALLHVDYFSDALGKAAGMVVLLPETTTTQIGASGAAPPEHGAPVLYLLHGHSDDHTAWTRRSSIERYAEEYGIVVVMPDGHRSFYTDEVGGLPHWTHLTEELPAKVASFFRVSTRREDTFVAGLSMGGYGAFRWALTHPERFAAAASLSGALDVAAISRTRLDGRLERIWGADGPGEEHDVEALLRRTAPEALPRLMLRCGSEDELAPMNHRFVDAAREHGAPLDVTFAPGEHTWDFWDTHIQDVLAWLPLDRAV